MLHLVLIDLHTHVFVGSKEGFADGFSSLSPDDITFKAGITTVVDAGTSGWRNFPVFKKQVIDRSQTRILAFLNIAGSGMTGFPSEEDINDMDPHMTSLVIQQYPDIIVGVKIGHYRGSEWTPLDRALEAGRIADVPLILECHLPNLPLEGILERMRPGDIYTHTFCTAVDRTCILDDNGKVRPYVLEALKKGIRFDVGHGGAMFHFSVAVPASQTGILAKFLRIRSSQVQHEFRNEEHARYNVEIFEYGYDNSGYYFPCNMEFGKFN